jgi:hypothetical protein
MISKTGLRIGLIERIGLLEAVRAQFNNRAFAPGTVDCVCVAHAHLTRAGHAMPALPHYKTLKKLGWPNLAAVLDDHLERISGGMMLPGDMAILEGENRSEALLIHGGATWLGFSQDHDVMVNLVDVPVNEGWRL